MEKFRKKIQRRRIVCLGALLVAALFACYNQFVIRPITVGFSGEVMSCFQIGLITAIGFLAAIQFFRLSQALKDDKKMKQFFNQEHDERMKLIRSKAGMPMMLITSILMIVAAIIAGYFNIVVFYTLLSASMVQLIMGATVKIYCLRKL